ncbi:MAG: CsbD family protein [Chloroflexota bacterium]|nr:CsbD family protein [Chloroflexota bacterium]
MGERMDELKGNIKEGAGKLTGDADLEAEGRGEQTIAGAKRDVKGAADQAQGAAKETIGKLADDERTQAEGTADRFRGEAKQTP